MNENGRLAAASLAWVLTGMVHLGGCSDMGDPARANASPAPVAESAAPLASEPATGFYDEPIRPLPRGIPLDPAKVGLGRDLFGDPRLSRDDTVACATCHDVEAGGTDGRPRSLGIDGRSGRRNAPTVLNSGQLRAVLGRPGPDPGSAGGGAGPRRP